MYKKLAVLITCHNRRSKTISCLNHLFSSFQSAPKVNICVYLVDDGSSDGTAEVVLDRFRNVNIIHGDGSLFWNGGMRLAWEEATKNEHHDYYLWLNDDTDIFDNAINDLINASFHFGNNAIIVGSVRSKNNIETTYGGYSESCRLDPNGSYQLIEYFNGNVVLVPHQVFKIVGNLDKRFKHSIGDIDYGLRAKKQGFNSYITMDYIGYCEKHPNIPIWCDKRYSFKQRLKSFRNATSASVAEHFIFDFRHKNFPVAIFHSFSILFRLIFPSIYDYIKK